MNNFKKLAAGVLAAAMAVSCAGCADQSWSYKTDDVSLTTGTYIYNLLNGYYEGYDLVESPDEVKDLLKEEVTGSDSDSQTKTLEQYAYDVADETTMRMIAVEDLFKQYGLEYDETEDEAAMTYADQVWSSAKKTLEGYGISQESFNYCYAQYTVKYGQVFEYKYGKEGDSYVDNDTLKKYFGDNCTGYAYFTLSMADTDENGESVAKSQEEFDKAQKDFDEYVKMINSGKSYKDVVGKYIADYELTYDPTMSGSFSENKTSSMPEEVQEAVKALDEGKASVITTGEDATTLYYFIYRPKNSEIEDYLDTDSDTAVSAASDTDEDSVNIYDLKSGYTRYSMLDEMKSDEFKDFLNEHADSLNVKKNDAAIKKYKPSMFISDSDSDK